MVVGQIVGSSTVEQVIGYFFCVLGLAGSAPLLDLIFGVLPKKGQKCSIRNIIRYYALLQVTTVPLLLVRISVSPLIDHVRLARPFYILKDTRKAKHNANLFSLASN